VRTPAPLANGASMRACKDQSNFGELRHSEVRHSPTPIGPGAPGEKCLWTINILGTPRRIQWSTEALVAEGVQHPAWEPQDGEKPRVMGATGGCTASPTFRCHVRVWLVPLQAGVR
jgi:hypothetical protein